MILPMAAGAGALVFAGFHSMLPKSQLYGRTFIGEERGSKRLALTFDDGPNDPHTQRLLDLLAEHRAKATFFMIGKFVERRPDVVRAVVAAGHEVGNHTYSHPNLIFRGARRVRDEIAHCGAALQEAAGVRANLFRPPWGGRLPGTLRTIRGAGYEPVMWSASSYDWKAPSAAQIVANLNRQVRGGDVILLHDGDCKQMGGERSLSVQATGEILRRYRGEGYEFVTVGEMMRG
jgi:peptidoglycan/xylan/chitin deacetylase (PgdA/CDA1 family)